MTYNVFGGTLNLAQSIICCTTRHTSRITIISDWQQTLARWKMCLSFVEAYKLEQAVWHMVQYCEMSLWSLCYVELICCVGVAAGGRKS